MKQIYPERLNRVLTDALSNHDASIKMTLSEDYAPKFAWENIKDATAFRGTVCSTPQIAKFGLVYDRQNDAIRDSASVNVIQFRMKCTEKMVYISDGISVEEKKAETFNEALIIHSDCMTSVPYVCEGDEVIVLNFRTKQDMQFCTVLNVTNLDFEGPGKFM